MTQFRILGPVTAVGDGQQPLRVGGPKPRTLLAVLLLADGRPVPAEQLISELWGDEPPASATTVLQVYISGLRKLFGDRLRRMAGGYALAVQPGELDATAFADLTDTARRSVESDPATASAGLTKALELWQGEPLSGTADSPAVHAARVRLAEQRMAAIEDRFSCELALGRHEQMVSELAELATANPMRERLTRQLMLAYYRSGRTADAERAFEEHRAELDTEPSDRLTALAEAIRRRDPTLDAPAGLVLPLPASRFIGRRRELDRLERLLGRTRLLTLTGPGGTGKTRLALQLARDLATQYPDGVHVVELAGTADDSAVAGRLAAELEVRELPGEPLLDSLVDRLRYARALVVLDNCEHVIDAVAGLATELLRQCAGLRLLATSREPLELAGEVVVPIDGLELPAAGARYEDAVRTEALRLLAERGSAARAGFRIEPETCAAAVSVVRRLDGLPLAIELAASRLRVLSLPELARRLDRRLDIAAGDARGLPPRHRTLRATIEWSHDLLDKQERALFARLAVFGGGFTLEAAEHVGADPDGGPPTEPSEVLDLLSRLVHRSLVVPDLVGDGTRYRMLETIGAYAAEHLDAGVDGPAARDRHAAWYQRLVEDVPQFGGDEHPYWQHLLSTELNNLRAAMAWNLTGGGQPERALTIADRIWWYWWVTGQMTEGWRWLERALAAADAAARPLRGDALRAAAALARNSGSLAEARRLGEQALEVQRTLGDPRGLAMAWNNLCLTATGQRDFDAALEFAGQCRTLAGQIGDERGLAIAANNSATVLRCTGRLDEADARYGEALERFAGIGDRRGEAAAVFNLGLVAALQDRDDEAHELLLRSLRLYADLELAEGELDAVEALAGLDLAADRPAEALHKLLVSERERRRLGAPVFVPDELDRREAALAAARAAVPDAEPPAESLQNLVDRLLTP